MSRLFVSQFLLPLVRGGTLFVGRPVSVADIQSWIQSPPNDPFEHQALALLARARHAQMSEFMPDPPAPALDPVSWRLGAVVHNLLAMSHPTLSSGPGAEGRLERIAGVTWGLAKMGPPGSVREALARHSLVARLPDVIRRDHTVRHRLGKTTFVGQRPPGRALALRRLRGVAVESQRRTWLRDVGVPVAARATFVALTEASPLGEALDPLRLDPPPSWGRLLSVLRFPGLCRTVAGRLCGLGVGRVGDALTAALYRFASLQEPGVAEQASPEAVAFGIQFLAHLVWLDVSFPPSNGASATADSAPNETGVARGGAELAVLLAAAEATAGALIWPPDVPRESDLGQRFARDLAERFHRYDVRQSARWGAARAIAEFASRSGVPALDAI